MGTIRNALNRDQLVPMELQQKSGNRQAITQYTSISSQSQNTSGPQNEPGSEGDGEAEQDGVEDGDGDTEICKNTEHEAMP